MKNLTNNEINELISECKDAKENGKSLVKIFDTFAKKYNKASGTVRNLYYKIVTNKDKFFIETEIPSILKPAFFKEFTRAETKSIVKTILINKTKNTSVRQSVYKMANGNEKLALRYQNKYRNLLKSQKETVINIAKSISEEYGVNVNPYKSESEEYLKIESEIDKLLNI